jgi:hypothetical protein
VPYKFRASDTFWRNLSDLSDAQRSSAQKAWLIFRNDPFDPRLHTHKIHALSARAGRTVYSVTVERDLRVLFYIDGDTIFSFDIGSHAIYN